MKQLFIVNSNIFELKKLIETVLESDIDIFTIICDSIIENKYSQKVVARIFKCHEFLVL